MQILRFRFCNDLTVSNLNISNSPKAHIRMNSCENATFSNISIHSPGDSPNTDGIDILASKNIVIQDSTMHCGKPTMFPFYVHESNLNVAWFQNDYNLFNCDSEKVMIVLPSVVAPLTSMLLELLVDQAME